MQRNKPPDAPCIVVLATAWGPKLGGINSFSCDLCCALSPILSRHTVVCIALKASDTEVSEAADSGINLLSLHRDTGTEFASDSWEGVISCLASSMVPLSSVEWWIGHDVKSGPLALEMARRTGRARAAVIMHMSYGHYQYAKHPGSQSAVKKIDAQRKVLSASDVAFAVGPLLFDRLREFRPKAKSVRLIPGLPEPASILPQSRVSAITFGRFEPEEALIKQAPLAVAGFASAFKQGKKLGLPTFEDATLDVVGVPDDQVPTLTKLAETHADKLLNLGIHGFIEVRSELRSRLEQSNLSMMLSWHEGFGLTGWEAIGMGIPTILSRESGVYRLLKEIGGQATGCVQALDIRGSSTTKERFSGKDLKELTDTILRIGTNLHRHLADADDLSRLLRTKEGFTWSSTAATFANALELPVAATTVGSTDLDRSILRDRIDIAEVLDQDATASALRLADAFIQRGQYDDALSTLSDLEHAGIHHNADLLFLKGEALLRLNRYDEAERLVASLRDAGFTLDPCQQIRADSILNTIYRDRGEHENAVAIGRGLAQLAESGCPSAISSSGRKLARALALLGKCDEALDQAQKSLRTAEDPISRAKALLAIGEAYRHGRNHVEAIKNYTESRNLAGILGHVDCYLWAALGLSDSLFLLGERDDAESFLKKLEDFVLHGNQRYPLEALHIAFSRAVISRVNGNDVDTEIGSLIEKYEALGVRWPRAYLDSVRAGDYSIPKKF
jgi:tetratricopeptide (TPR) repeat protein/glycosyltransferase involved in cell wall biosynthesis